MHKLRNVNETDADVLHTSYNGHCYHTRFHWSPKGRVDRIALKSDVTHDQNSVGWIWKSH